jgi:pathogenesis-related protein 1
MKRSLKLIVCLAAAAVIFHADESVAQQFEAAHNAVRMRVGVPPLRWSAKLAQAAQQWADNLLRKGTLDHQVSNPNGENLYEMDGSTASPADVVNDWASEARDYDYKDNSCSAVCGHYTQIVWRKTEEVGCAAAQSRTRQVWVCEYFPPGNYEGQRPY